jgi:transposase
LTQRIPRQGVREWKALCGESKAYVQALWDWIAVLEGEAAKNSRNSSQPPSRDGSEEKARTNAKKRRRRRRGRRRKRGGQEGHPGHQRALVPPERVDRREHHHPSECRGCGYCLVGVAPHADPLRHQVAETPESRAFVTEHLRYQVTCPECGIPTTAPLPPGVPTVCFGPNLRALVVLLIGRYRLSRRETVELCGDVFGISVSVGTVANITAQATEALALPYAEAERAVKESPVCYMDETGWRQKGRALHLWIAVVLGIAVLFRIGRRTKKVAQELLGKNYGGVVVSDRYAGYRWIPDERHQTCWSHLDRRFESLVERGGEARAFGRACLRQSRKLHRICRAFKEGRIRWRTMRRQMVRVETQVGGLLQDGLLSVDAEVRRLCQSLLEIQESLFVFVRIEGVEPTNNVGERGVRPAVQWRKICFGTQSRSGSRFVERILTVVSTRRMQGRSVLAYLRAVFLAVDRRTAVPSLLARPGPGCKAGEPAVGAAPLRRPG